MALIDTVKEYAKIDGNGSNTEVAMLINAAKRYLTNAGIEADDGNGQYVLAVAMLVTHWHDNRGAVVIGSISKELEFSLRSIITQLQFCYPENEG
jgi:hypothetical protein